MKGLRKWVLAGALTLAAPLVSQATTSTPAAIQQQSQYVANQVRHELLMLPYYSIFDDLNYQLAGDTVVLTGHVVRPVLKSDAENAVKRVEGVHHVVNNIQVLPLSSFDNSIRFHEMRAIYGFPSLQRYGMGVHPSIHIIVNNGNVTLTGVVDSETDRNLAGIRANGVFGVFSVKNDLRVANTRS